MTSINMSLLYWIVLAGLVRTSTCATVPQFSPGEIVANMTTPLIPEASGVCESRRYPGVLYIVNDSGETNRFFAISAKDASLLAVIYVANVTTQDWEDIACGPCAVGTGNCIYIGDFGGNAGPPADTIILVKEPDSNPANAAGGEMHETAESILQFNWDEPDCETLMVDPNGETYLVTKVTNDTQSKLYHVPRGAWGTGQRVNLTGGVTLSIPISSRRDPTAGDISPDGHEVIIKTYKDVYYWYATDFNYGTHLTSEPTKIPYIEEVQGESICFDASGKNYYTISEGVNASLYVYRRIGDTSHGTVWKPSVALYLVIFYLCLLSTNI